MPKSKKNEKKNSFQYRLRESDDNIEEDTDEEQPAIQPGRKKIRRSAYFDVEESSSSEDEKRFDGYRRLKKGRLGRRNSRQDSEDEKDGNDKQPRREDGPARVPLYGEIKCQAKTGEGMNCTNGAYFQVGQGSNGGFLYLCGVHSGGKRNPHRKILKKMTKQQKDDMAKKKLLFKKKAILKEAKLNLAAKRLGRIGMCKEKIIAAKLGCGTRVSPAVSDAPGPCCAPHAKTASGFKH